MKKQLTELSGIAFDAVGHVGFANYAEREREARAWVRKAADAAEESLDQLIKYLSDFGELSGKQAAYLVCNFDPKTECYHLNVKVYSRLTARETRFQPAEYEYKAQCNDCGKWMDIEDVPDEAEGRDE